MPYMHAKVFFLCNKIHIIFLTVCVALCIMSVVTFCSIMLYGGGGDKLVCMYFKLFCVLCLQLLFDRDRERKTGTITCRVCLEDFQTAINCKYMDHVDCLLVELVSYNQLFMTKILEYTIHRLLSFQTIIKL